MKYRLALSAAAITTAALGAVACAHASPQPPPNPPAAPQIGVTCPENLDGALTVLPELPGSEPSNAKNILQCAGGSWQPYADPYPSPERWLTTGSELILHGQGMRNPEFRSGTWSAVPQSADAQCTAEQVDVVAAGQTSAPRTLAGSPGEVLTIPASTALYTITLTGFCLWERTG